MIKKLQNLLIPQPIPKFAIVKNIIIKGNIGFISWGFKLKAMTSYDLLFPHKADF